MSNDTSDPPPYQPVSLSELIDEVITRRSYPSLLQMSAHTTIPYSTLYSWAQGTRNQKRPPSVQVLRKFAADFGMPESMVFRAAGRTYADPGALDSRSFELLDRFKSLPEADQVRLVRIVASFQSMAPEQRILAERLVRSIENP